MITMLCSVAQSCPALFDPMSGNPISYSAQDIFQARILEWVTISFSRVLLLVTLGRKGWVKVKSESEVAQSCLTLCDPMDYSLPGSSVHGIFQARVLE